MKFTPGPYTQKHTIHRTRARENYKFFKLSERKTNKYNKKKKEKVVTLIIISKYSVAKVIGFFEK